MGRLSRWDRRNQRVLEEQNEADLEVPGRVVAAGAARALLPTGGLAAVGVYAVVTERSPVVLVFGVVCIVIGVALFVLLLREVRGGLRD